MKTLLQLIRQGESVSPGVANRPLEQLSQNFAELLQWFEAALVGSTVFARQVPVDSTVVIGTPVYLDPATLTFKAALAQTTTDLPSGQLLMSETAQVWGVVYAKDTATLADILLAGYAPLNLTNVADAPLLPGLYYLSGQQAGRLVRQRPPVSVPVLRYDGDGKVFVLPVFTDALDSHRHYRFPLVCQPAGTTTPPVEGERHVITDPDTALPGWLPANHEIFEGLAPADAAFGYNLSQHVALQNAWPPIPLSHAYVEWDRGEDYVQGFHGVPLGLDGLLVLDRNGLWWMSDCYRDVPWPVSLNTHESQSEGSQGLENPRTLTMAMNLWFTKLNLATGGSLVTSLTTTDSRIRIVCAGTQSPASRGDLEISLDLDLTVQDTNEIGYQVMKTMVGGFIKRGPVIEGVYTTSPGVSLTGDAQQLLDPDDEQSPVLHQGRVRVNISAQATMELQAQLVRLEGATEEHIPLLYLGLPPERIARFIARFDVPYDAPSGSVTYRARLLGRGEGTTPALYLSYYIVPRPASPFTISTPTYTSAVFDTEEAVVANTCFEVESEPFAANPGDTIFVKVERRVDAYAGELGVVNHGLILRS